MIVNLMWYFLIYSFLGFGLEILFARCTGHPKKDRKCLLVLPLCPVYGLGAVGILSLPQAVLSRPQLLFPAGAIAATAAEYLMALFYEKVWRVSFWNYTGVTGSVQGRICLPFSLAWGALSLPLVYALHPAVAAFAAGLSDQLLVPLFSLFLADSLVTGHLLRQSGTTDSLKWYTPQPRQLEAGGRD